MTKSNQIVTETITDSKKVANHLFGYVYKENAVISTAGEFRIVNSYEIDTVPVENDSMFDEYYVTRLSVYVRRKFSINPFENSRSYGMTVYIRDSNERIIFHDAIMSEMSVTDDVKRDRMWLTDTNWESIGQVVEYDFSCNTKDITVEKLSTS